MLRETIIESAISECSFPFKQSSFRPGCSIPGAEGKPDSSTVLQQLLFPFVYQKMRRMMCLPMNRRVDGQENTKEEMVETRGENLKSDDGLGVN